MSPEKSIQGVIKMENNKKLKLEIKQIKKKLAEEKERIESIDELIKKKVDREAGIWEFDIGELEEEMWRRFASLEKNAFYTPGEEIKPRGKKIAWIIYPFKKILRIITLPFVRLLLARQNRLNRELIPLHLAAILSLQKMKDRLNILEERTAKLMEEQEELVDELKALKSTAVKNKKES